MHSPSSIIEGLSPAGVRSDFKAMAFHAVKLWGPIERELQKRTFKACFEAYLRAAGVKPRTVSGAARNVVVCHFETAYQRAMKAKTLDWHGPSFTHFLNVMERFAADLGSKVQTVATGGQAGKVSHCVDGAHTEEASGSLTLNADYVEGKGEERQGAYGSQLPVKTETLDHLTEPSIHSTHIPIKIEKV